MTDDVSGLCGYHVEMRMCKEGGGAGEAVAVVEGAADGGEARVDVALAPLRPEHAQQRPQLPAPHLHLPPPMDTKGPGEKRGG